MCTFRFFADSRLALPSLITFWPSLSAALRWHGYRSESRYMVFQCLPHTLELPNEQWRVLDQAHRKRNLAEYEGHLDIDEALTEAVIRVALEIEGRVVQLGPPG